MNNNSKSIEAFRLAQNHIPGGVNSPVRAFQQVGGTPLFMSHAQGAYLYDLDGNSYIDYINSWGPMILGHGHAEVVKAVQSQAQKAFSFGAPTCAEVDMAALIKKMVPNIDLIRMVSSGTEACMSAVRLARGFTKKNKIIKFEGHYHGHADSFLKKAGSGLATLGIQQEGGVPKCVADDTLIATFNNIEQIEKIIEQQHTEIACIILEPVAGNMGCVLPQKNFLERIRTFCTQHNIVFIMDEVMTGFRLARGGAQEKLNVWADLVTYGKVIGGGMPVGAFGGRKDIMSCIAPLGNVYQAGTLSGNPIAMAAGYTTLSILNNTPSIYQQLERATQQLKNAFEIHFKTKQKEVQINQCGSMISLHFCTQPVTNFSTASAGNNETFKQFFHHCLAHGVYLSPSPFETWFISAAIQDAEIKKTIDVVTAFHW